VREPDGHYPTPVQRTELGEFPADWQVVPLGEFEPFITSGSRGWAAYYADMGSPFLRITNLSRSCIYPSLRDLRYVAVPPDNSEGVRTALRTADVLISITADIGIVGFVTEEVELPAYINQHIALVRLNGRLVSSRYIAYFLAGAAAQRRFKSMTDAGAKAGMNLTGVRDVLAALPPSTDEQTAIADALTDADALIDSLEQLLTKKRQIKQGAMQELLTGKRRLPGFTGLVQKIDLGSVCKMQSGGTPAVSQSAYFDGPHPWVSISDITNADKYLSTTERSLSNAGLNACAAQILPAGTVLYAMYASVGECCIAAVAVCTSQAILAMQPARNLDPEYLYYSLTSSKAKAKSAVQQGTQGNLNKGIVQVMEIRLPEVAEQRAIARTLADMDAEIAALESRLTKARALKQAMAQALLTGRIRLLEPTE